LTFGKGIVACQLRQWLRERLTVLCYTYMAYLVEHVFA
jgi:hypothetical protein